MANGKETPTIQELKWALWVDIRHDPELSSTSKLIANVLVDYFNVEKGYAWPPIESIAEAIGRAPRTVERNLPTLIGRYFNYRQGGGRRPGGNGKTNEYIPIWRTPSDVSGYIEEKDKKEVDTPTKLAKNPDKVDGNTPSDVSVHTFNNTFNNTFKGERAASPPEGGGAPSRKKRGLQGRPSVKAPPLVPRLPGPDIDAIVERMKAEDASP